jgi:hypothetical protein
MLLAIAAIPACSKQNPQLAAEATPQKQAMQTQGQAIQAQGAALSLRNVYSISLNGQTAYLITELQNSGKAGIVAFQSQWAIKDDLDATLADLEVRYTSDTPYVTTDGIKSTHIIGPGETLLIVNWQIRGEPEKVWAMAKDDIGVLPLTALNTTNLDDYRVTKKITFQVEKIVTR